MADVVSALHASGPVDIRGERNLHNLGSKEELLHVLLANEQMRLVVWLYPLDHERRHIFTSSFSKNPQDVSDCVMTSGHIIMTFVALNVHY